MKLSAKVDILEIDHETVPLYKRKDTVLEMQTDWTGDDKVALKIADHEYVVGLPDIVCAVRGIQAALGHK